MAKRIKRRADNDMAVGIVSELSSRGYKASEFNMLAYGGNGPLHCCGIAAAANIGQVLIPPFSSVFSACGAGGMAQLHIHEYTRTTAIYNQLTKEVFSDYDGFNAIVARLEERGRHDLLRQGCAPETVRHRLELDIRYGAQKIETGVVFERNRLVGQSDVFDLIAKHRLDYEHRFGLTAPAPETGIWISNFRVASYVEHQPVKFGDLRGAVAPRQVTATGRRCCHFVGHDGALDCPVFGADALAEGVSIDGPAIVTTGVTTYLVEPGWRFTAAAQGAIWMKEI